MDMTEKRIERKDIFDGHVFKVYLDKVEISDGSIRPREVVEHNGGVCVVALDEKKEIYMVRQYRYAAGTEMLEIPAGKLEKGEDPFKAAKRELSEETGCTAEKWTSLGVVYPTPGYCSERLYIYLAQELKTGEMHLDDGEILTVEKYPISQVVDMIMSGEITDAKTVVGVLKTTNLVNV